MSRHFSTRSHSGRTYARRRGVTWPVILDGVAVCHDCGAPFEPICSTYKCAARRGVLRMLEVEKGAGDAAYFGDTADGWGRVDAATAKRQRREAVESQRYAGRNRAARRRRPNARRSAS